MRFYEATGMGALLLTDAKQNLGELELGNEVVAYGSEEEFVELARHYLEQEDERQEISAAGQRRVLAEHAYAIRMRELIQIVSRYSG